MTRSASIQPRCGLHKFARAYLPASLSSAYKDRSAYRVPAGEHRHEQVELDEVHEAPRLVEVDPQPDLHALDLLEARADVLQQPDVRVDLCLF